MAWEMAGLPSLRKGCRDGVQIPDQIEGGDEVACWSLDGTDREEHVKCHGNNNDDGERLVGVSAFPSNILRLISIYGHINLLMSVDCLIVSTWPVMAAKIFSSHSYQLTAFFGFHVSCSGEKIGGCVIFVAVRELFVEAIFLYWLSVLIVFAYDDC